MGARDKGTPEARARTAAANGAAQDEADQAKAEATRAAAAEAAQQADAAQQDAAENSAFEATILEKMEQFGLAVEQAQARAEAAEARAEAAEARAATIAAIDDTAAEGPSADVLERLTTALERLGTTAPSVGAFRPGESAQEVEQSLEGTVSNDPPLLDGQERVDPVTFISKGPNFVLVHKSRHRSTSSNGEVNVTQGVSYDFAPSGSFTTDNPRAIEYLRGRPSFNVEYWELGNEPGAAPAPDLVIDAIMAAALELDDDALAEIERNELAGHGREVVLTQIRSARRRVQGVTAGRE